MNYTMNELERAMRYHLDYLGLDLVEISQSAALYHEVFLVFKHTRDHKLIKPDEQIKDVLEPIFDSIKNSDYIRDIRKDYEKQIEKLTQENEDLIKTNAELSEGLSNGMEYLEQIDEN